MSKKKAKAKPKKGKKLKPLHPGRDFKKPVRRAPTQPRLPGMEDPAIQELEDRAREFSDLRLQRANLLVEMANVETLMVAIMEREGKQKYFHAGVLVRLAEKSKRVNVRIDTKPPKEKKVKAEDEAPADED